MIRMIVLVAVGVLVSACDDSTSSEESPETPAVDVGSLNSDGGVALSDDGVGAARLVINEVLYAPAGDDSDWIELTVVGEGSVELSDYTLIDDDPNHIAFTLPAGALGSGEYAVVTRQADEGGDGFEFGLGKSDSLSLKRGDDLVDEVSWSEDEPVPGAGYGRLPDGVGAWGSTNPTPGGPNQGWEQEVPVDPIFDTSRVISVELVLSADAWNAIRNDPMAEEYQSGAIIFDGTRVDNVAIRVKGNSSLNSVARSASERFSFKVDVNRFVAGQELHGIKKLNFNNGFKDPTLMREHLGYELVRRSGMPGSRTAFVDLTVAGQHMGLYVLVEQVDDEFLKRSFGNDSGDLYKPEPPSGQLGYRGAMIDGYPSIGVENNEDTTDHSAFLRFIGVLNGQLDGRLDDVINVDAVLRNLALNTVMVNLDSYLGMGHNFYLYEQDGQFVDIPWDLNETYGNFTCQCDRDGLINLKIDEPTCGPIAERPFVSRLLANPDYVERYHAILRELVDGPAALEVMMMQVRITAEIIRPFVEADPTKFFSIEDFDRGLTDDVGGRRGGAWGLERFIRDRNEAIRRQLDGADPSTNSGNGSCGMRGGGMPGGMQGGGQDCPPCGDGVCDAFETANPEVCPRDCQEPPEGGDWCGDGVCDALERCEGSCEADCG